MLASGDGAFGFWKAVSKAWLSTKHQRCWTHKTASVPSHLPKSAHEAAKGLLHGIWMGEGRELVSKAIGQFVKTYEAKYPKATACLVKDRRELLAFYDFPAERWRYLRTSNSIESTFATVRQRTSKTRASGSRSAMLAMVLKLALSAEARWRKPNGGDQQGALIEGVQFIDGIRPKNPEHAEETDAAA